MKKNRCKICGNTHEGEIEQSFVCPVCKKDASFFEEITEEISKINNISFGLFFVCLFLFYDA